MQKFTTFADALAAKADADTLAHYVVGAVSAFTEGKDVTFDFLAKGTVGIFCTSLGIKRNWAELSLDEIAPLDERDINVVPLDEAASVLALMKALIRDHHLTPSENDQPERAILNDFLPAGGRFANEKTYGHLWEFAYALAVELEHGRERGQNITMNHPLLTGMVVLAHLAEDTLSYARLLVMATEGEIFNAQLKRRRQPPRRVDHSPRRCARHSLRRGRRGAHRRGRLPGCFVRVVLDTNVIVAELATRGACAELFARVLAVHDYGVDANLHAEVERVLRVKFKLPDERIAAARELLASTGVAVDSGPLLPKSGRSIDGRDGRIRTAVLPPSEKTAARPPTTRSGLRAA